MNYPIAAAVVALLAIVLVVGIYSYTGPQPSLGQQVQTVNTPTTQVVAQNINQDKMITIESASGSSVVISNSGQSTIYTSELNVYTPGGMQPCAWSAGYVASRSRVTCTLSTPCARGTAIRVSAPGNSDTVICE